MELNTAYLFKRYYKSLCHYAWTLTHDLEIAKDVVHDVFVAYHNNSEEVVQHEKVIQKYLFSSVRFACYNLVRKDKIVDRYWSRTGFEESCENDIERKIIRSELLAEVLRIIEKKPHSCANIFRKGYLEGLSNSEIAEELKISVNTVKTQKLRGLRLLKEGLNPEFYSLLVLFFLT